VSTILEIPINNLRRNFLEVLFQKRFSFEDGDGSPLNEYKIGAPVGISKLRTSSLERLSSCMTKERKELP
jgi:hypothetical protein